MLTGLQNKKILVTGGAGFVGSNLVRTLVQKHSAKVTVLDDLFNGNLDNLEGVEHRFVRGSVEDKDLVHECVSNQEIVFHFAVRNINVSNVSPRDDLNINVGGSFNVFEACLQHKVTRVIYASTSAIYGNPHVLPVEEEAPKNFLNIYSAGKFSAEVYAKAFYEVYGLPITILRYSNIYGPYQSPVNPYCGVIGKFIAAALAGEPLFVRGDGRQTRDYTYIHDAITATLAATLHPGAIGHYYNIATGVQTSVIELAKAIIKITGSSSAIVHVENLDIDNIRHRCLDITKAERDLHYQPSYTVEKGLKATVHWFLRSLVKVGAGVAVLANVLVA